MLSEWQRVDAATTQSDQQQQTELPNRRKIAASRSSPSDRLTRSAYQNMVNNAQPSFYDVSLNIHSIISAKATVQCEVSSICIYKTLESKMSQQSLVPKLNYSQGGHRKLLKWSDAG